MKYCFSTKSPAFSVSKNQQTLMDWMHEHNIDVVLLTAQDRFLSEYTPRAENQRHAFSGFTGSVGDGFFFHSKHLQSLNLNNIHLLNQKRYS